MATWNEHMAKERSSPRPRASNRAHDKWQYNSRQKSAPRKSKTSAASEWALLSDKALACIASSERRSSALDEPAAPAAPGTRRKGQVAARGDFQSESAWPRVGHCRPPAHTIPQSRGKKRQAGEAAQANCS